jgi:DNA-binding response OmpR family regulator
MTDARRASGIDEPRYRVVVADDDADSRALLTAALTAADFEVTQAHDGKELLHVLTTVPAGFFKVVVADQRMPHMLGLEVLSQTSSRARFIILTGHDTEVLRATAARLGAAAVLAKPSDVSSVVALVEKIIREIGRTTG